MQRRHGWLCSWVLLVSLISLSLWAQQVQPEVPRFVNYSGVLLDGNNKAITSVTGVTFSLYKEQQGGAALWMETQNIHPDKAGNYTVMLGSSSTEGLPSSLFVAGEARWLGVQIQGQAEQPRVMLLAVPYALKAGDAQTLGGLPASAFVLAVPSIASGAANSAATPAGGGNGASPQATITGSGTVNFLPIWTGTSVIGNSVLFQSGTGATAKLGINTTTPASTLDVKGAGTIRGLLSLPATGTATATKGFTSQPTQLGASSFNSGTSAAVAQTFQWQAEPTGNNTASPSGTLNLLFGQGTAKPAETGLHIANNGQITFASGQAFPGAGTITGVTAGTDLTGGGTSGTVKLNLDTTKVPQLGTANTFTANQTVNGTLSATSLSGNGSAITNVNANQLGGLSSSSFAKLASANTFTAAQTINGTVAITATSGTNVLTATANGNLNAIGASTSSTSGGAIVGTVTSSSGTSIGVTGSTPSGSGVGVYGINSSSGAGVEGVSGSNSGYSYPASAVWGDSLNNTGVTGSSANWYGVLGTSTNQNGVIAFSTNSSALWAESTGNAPSATAFGEGTSGVGTYGVSNSSSFTGLGFASAGAWGDSGTSGHFGVLGTVDDGNAFWGKNNTVNHETLYLENDATNNGSSLALVARFAGPGAATYCYISRDGSNISIGDLVCTGSKSAAVPVDGNRMVRLYAVEAADNWFEDAGAGQITNGSAVIRFDPTFSQTISGDTDYHVFLTPEGECEGLYVTNKGANGFEVHELRGGHSNVAFSYRIMAKRKGYENVRMQDVSVAFANMKAESEAIASRVEQQKAYLKAHPRQQRMAVPPHKGAAVQTSRPVALTETPQVHPGAQAR
jgi:hypothetical protein